MILTIGTSPCSADPPIDYIVAALNVHRSYWFNRTKRHRHDDTISCWACAIDEDIAEHLICITEHEAFKA